MLDKEAIVGYYMSTKGDNLEDYTAEDYYMILITPCYKELPRVVTKAIGSILLRYWEGFPKAICKEGITGLNAWEDICIRVETENPEMNKVEYVEVTRDIPFKQLDTQTYKNLIDRYIQISIEDYFIYITKILVEVEGLGYSPMMWYLHKMGDVMNLALYCLGEEETVRILKESNKAFYTQLKDSEWVTKGANYGLQDIEEVIWGMFKEQRTYHRVND